MSIHEVDNTENVSQLFRDGYIILDFKKTALIAEIQKKIIAVFGFDPTGMHHQSMDDNQRLKIVKSAKDAVVKAELVKNIILENLECFTTLLGPDIDIQSDIYLRVSRPSLENDFIDWHRDTFYGNSHWELNLWFPVFPLEENSGLSIVIGSHFDKFDNVRYKKDQNEFRKTVKKGSLANELGYLYAPKTDDVIDNIQKMSSSQIKLLSPQLGQAIFFFANCVHRAQNLSSKTRVSIDIRLKNMLGATNTKTGYYQPLIRGDIARFVEKIQ